MTKYNYFMTKENMNEGDLDSLKVYLEELSEVYYNTSDAPELTDEEFDILLKKYETYRDFIGGAVPEGSGKRLVDLSHTFPELVGTRSEERRVGMDSR